MSGTIVRWHRSFLLNGRLTGTPAGHTEHVKPAKPQSCEFSHSAANTELSAPFGVFVSKLSLCVKDVLFCFFGFFFVFSVTLSCFARRPAYQDGLMSSNNEGVTFYTCVRWK